MEKKYLLDIVITKEKLSTKKAIFVAHCTSLGITSQGENIKEARKNIKEAIELYLEEEPKRLEDLTTNEAPLFSVFEVKKGAKTSHPIRSRNN
ncbi:MAG: type II toxin-antitoxin system HicB family antitoxin [bacterium]|nr:type II toxin-antitoxin system HicB family antitoxin [bacterium]